MADWSVHEDSRMTAFDTPLPQLNLEPERKWHWPESPFARDSTLTLPDGSEQPCRIETPTGVAIDGWLVGFDADTCLLSVRFCPDGEPLSLPFAKIRRLTLTRPWPVVRRGPGESAGRLPGVVQERGYRIDLAAGGHLTGRTMGHVKQPCGVFLFVPLDDAVVVQRMFVPAAAFSAVSFGPSDEEQAASRWISTPEQLIAAVDAPRQAHIKPLGQALLDLGLVTRGQLERALAAQGPGREAPLGELLVAEGVIGRADLQAAMAHKMGYPIVDLARFPIDTAVARRLSHAAMREHGAVPLMQHGDRLFVAVDDLARVAQLNGLRPLAGLKLVPVLACRSRMSMAFRAPAQQLRTDVWGDNVALTPSQFDERA